MSPPKRPGQAVWAEPLDPDAVLTVRVGTVLWAVGLLALLPFYSRLVDDGHQWWLWMCVSGVVLGAIGIWFTTRRRRVRQAHRAAGRVR